jgi:ubiquinone/menaquinone biosynthesis C-methylase UbiE
LERAEALPFDDASFDMGVSCLSLLDSEGIAAVLDEVKRVLGPGRRVLFADLSGVARAAGLKGEEGPPCQTGRGRSSFAARSNRT